MSAMVKGLSTSVAIVNGSVQVELIDVDYGYTAKVRVVTTDGFSPRLCALLV